MPPSDNVPLPAATTLLLRDNDTGLDVFMVQRRKGPRFGEAYVFPGGRVDPQDGLLAAQWLDQLDSAVSRMPDLLPEQAIAYHVAAIRELFEEASVLLARDLSGIFVTTSDPVDRDRVERERRDLHGKMLSLAKLLEQERLRLALDALTPYAHWVTPPVDTGRFDTRFFVARVPAGQTPAPDAVETLHGAWLSPVDALEAARRAEILLPPPTWVTLRELERFGSVASVIDAVRSRPIRRREPRLRQEGGARYLIMPGDPLHPDYGVHAAEFVSPETRFVWAGDRWRPVM
jgi:8-oxo-dGTP pyrophosphatase MutT (NUDIX family)